MPDASHDDPITPNAFTLLRMVGIGVPPYSARGVSQTLAHIEAAANLKRTANGKLVDISFSGFRKYKTSITCSDQRPPNLDGKWPGKIVTIDCVAELSFTPDEGETAQRVAVPGSLRVEGAHTVYRPRLECRVISFTQNADEWAAGVQWTIEAEEI